MATALTKVSEKEAAMDTQIACGMAGMVLFSPPGIANLVAVLKGANDPAAAIAHVIFLVLSQVRTALLKKNMKIDERVWIAGGGVLDRVIFDTMGILYAAAQFQDAGNPQFVHKVKSDVLDLMEGDDQQAESVKTLHDKGLPMPASEPQGLVAPQSQGQPQQAGPLPEGAPQ